MILKRKYSADKEIRRPIFSKRNSKIRSFAECPLKNRLFIKIHKVKVYLLHECAPPSFFVAAADDGFQENTFLPFENCNKISSEGGAGAGDGRTHRDNGHTSERTYPNFVLFR